MKSIVLLNSLKSNTKYLLFTIDESVTLYANESSQNQNPMAYSAKIHDPKFQAYKLRSKNWKLLFSFILAAIAVIGFYFYGETSPEMNNPEAIQIGMGLGLLFILIGIFSGNSNAYMQTWDGIIIDKSIKHKTKDIGYDHIKAERIVYQIVIQADNGKIHEILTEDDDTVYNYFDVGDKVRHHGGLHSYEKFNKSKDKIVFCNACGFLHSMEEEVCKNCGCPLLK